MHSNTSSKRWLRKRQVRERYGDVAARTIERAVEAGRLPPPEFPFNNRIPFWDEAALEAHERAVIMTRREPAEGFRPIGEAARRVVDRVDPTTLNEKPE